MFFFFHLKKRSRYGALKQAWRHALLVVHVLLRIDVTSPHSCTLMRLIFVKHYQFEKTKNIVSNMFWKSNKWTKQNYNFLTFKTVHYSN